MNERRMHIDDKEKMFNTHKGMWSNFSLSVLSLFDHDEEISTKELSEKSKNINAGHRYKKSAINKVLTHDLKDKVVSCGKNKWRLKDIG